MSYSRVRVNTDGRVEILSGGLPMIRVNYDLAYDFSTGYPAGFWVETITSFFTSDAAVFDVVGGTTFEVYQDGNYLWTMIGQLTVNDAVLDETLGTTRLFPGEAVIQWGVSNGFGSDGWLEVYRSLTQGVLMNLLGQQYNWHFNNTDTVSLSGGPPYSVAPVVNFADALIPSGGAFVPTGTLSITATRLGSNPF